MEINEYYIKERLNDVLFYVGVNFWYIFLIIAVLFFLLSIKFFKDKVKKELELQKLNKWLLYISKLNKISEVEDNLLVFKNYLDALASAIYLKRGETYILQAYDGGESVNFQVRIRKSEIKEKQKIGKHIFYMIPSHSQETLYVLACKKYIELEDYIGFIKMGLSYYEKIEKITKEHQLSNITNASKEVLSNIVKFQYESKTFIKFIISLLLKTLHAKGIILIDKNEPKKLSVFRKPEESKLQKRFYIRNTPYILEIYKDEPLTYEEISEVGAFLDLAGGYFESASQNSKIVQNYINFLKFAINAIELQSSYFKDHSKKVEIVAKEIAKALFLEDKEIEKIALGAYLHDIGMIGKMEHFIDGKKIDKKELELIKYHPIIGATIVEPISQVYNIAPIIKYHHERYDGTGYPFGLKGKEIPLSAQIVALAEYYVGITSPRAYRKALSHEEALEDIKKKSDYLVEKGIIEVFLENEGFIKKKLDLLSLE